MPGGLPEIVQPVGADTSKYVSEYRAALAVTKELAAARKELAQAGDVLGGAGGGSTAAMIADIGKLNAGYREHLAILGQVQPATVGLGTAHAAAAALIAATGAAVRDTTGGVSDMTAKFEQARSVIAGMAADALRQNEQMAASFDRVRVSSAGSGESVLSYARNIGLVRDTASDAAAAVDDVSRAVDALQGKASGAGPATISILGAALAGRMAAGGGGGGGGGGARNAIYDAMNSWGAQGGAGGGGGGGGAFLGGLTSGGSTAGGQWGTVSAFLGTWLPRIHYAVMAANEVLATVGPAVVAAGAATAVMAQGGQQVANRLQAVYAVAESLGPSLGTTAGQFLGGGNALQQAQNLGGGGAYELLGAGINIAKSSAGGAFAQLGLNTEAMITRAAATITQDFQGGMGNRISGLVSGGTGYLQQFGDILGNVGKTFLNTAPNLPGVGGDYLSILQGATGGLSRATGYLGPALQPILAYEAASRLGTPLVGGLGTLLGKAPGGILGTATDAAAGVEGTGVAGFLTDLTAGDVGAIGAVAMLLGKGATYRTPAQQWAGGLQSQVAQSGFLTGIPNLISGMSQLAGVPYSGAPGAGPQQNYLAGAAKDFASLRHGDIGGAWSGSVQAMHGLLQLVGVGGGTDPNKYQTAQTSLDSMAHTFVNLLNAGQQVQGVWKGVSHSAVSMSDAFNIATMAQLQLGSAFSKNGQLTGQAKTMIQNLYAGYAPMVMNTGQFGAATGVVTAMQGLGKTQLSTVNSALDQLVQIVSGGAAGTASYAGQLAALPAGTRQALTSFTSPAAQAAWSAFASTTQPSVVSSLQQQTDWLRTAQTMGALGAGQTTGMAAYYLGGALPAAKSSPAALSMLSTIAQEYGGPAVRPGESASSMFSSLNNWVKTFGDTGKQFNQAMTTGTEKLSSIPRDAQQFVTTAQGQLVGGLAQGIATYGSGLQSAFMTSISKGGMPGAAGSYAEFLKKSGVPEAGAVDMAQYAAGLAGASKAQLGTLTEKVKLIYDATTAPKFTPIVEHFTPPPAPKGGVIEYPSHAHPPDAPPAPHGGVVVYPSRVTTPVAPPAPRGGVVVYTSTVIGPSMSQASINAAGSATVAGAPGIRAHGQSGFRVPGTGSGDTFPAMLEPGELVVPRGMVSAGAVDHLRGSIPGFASGGIAGVSVPDVTGLGMPMRIAMQSGFNQMTSGLNTYLGGLMQPYGGGGGGSYRQGLPISQAVPVKIVGTSGGTGFSIPGHVPLPPAASKVIDSFEETFKKMKSPWGKLSSDILSEMLAGIKDGKKETAAMAKALVGQVSSEIGSLKGMGSPWAGIAAQIMSGMLDGIKGNKGETAAMAQAMFGQVTKEVNYMRTVAGATNAISQWGSFGGGLATPTTTAQGQNYQYYTDQQTIAGGGTVSVQQNMGDYLQAMKSFQGDIGKLSKGGINKQMLQQIIGAGPLQGDQEAQSILGGGGGVKGANQLWNQINAMSKSLGITAGQDVYGFGAGGAGGKNVKVGANVTGTAAVHALHSAINQLQGKTVTIQVHVVESGSGSAGTGSKLNKTEIKAVTSQVQASLLQQAKRNRRTGISLPGYGT